MAQPLTIPHCDEIDLGCTVEVARLNDRGSYNITVKYQPLGMFSPTLNIHAEYDGKDLRIKEVDIVNKGGVHAIAVSYFRGRISDMEKLLKDERILGYIERTHRESLSKP